MRGELRLSGKQTES